MRKINEKQFRAMCDLYRAPKPLLEEKGMTLIHLVANGMIVADEEKPCWFLTEEGRTYVEDKGRELAKPDFGSLGPDDKRVIIDEKVFPESDRRRLIFDTDMCVSVWAIRKLDLTEEEFIRLGDSPDPFVRYVGLEEGREFLRDGKELDRKLSRYLEHDDKQTVGAVLEALRDTGNIGFVDEDRINHWFETDIPDGEMLRLLCQAGVRVSETIIDALLEGDDSEVRNVMALYMRDRLDSARVDKVIAVDSEVGRVNIAISGENLTASQVKRLLVDEDPQVNLNVRRRLTKLAKALRMIEDDPKLVTWIRSCDFLCPEDE